MLDIAASLERFLSRGRIERVFFAGGRTPPPPLAYLVNFPRISLLLAGRDQMDVEVDGQVRTLALQRGDAVFVPPNCWNHPAWRPGVTVLTFLFGKRQTGASLVRQKRQSQGLGAVKTHFHRPPDAMVSSILEALGHLATQPSRHPTDRLLVQALMHRCLQLLREPHTHGKASRTFHGICLYLQENFHFDLTRDSVARHFGLSPNHVSRVFRTQGSMKFADYLTCVRLDRAKFLLRNHDWPLDEVAEKCGFNEAAYFCRVFRRRTKMTPTQYRRS